MEPPGHRRVGWSILSSLAQAQLRRGRSVVLDGVARTPEIEQCRQLAHEEGSRFVVIFTQCTNPAIHRSRVEGRSRDIPNWYELNWDDVEGSIGTWQPPDHFDLMLDAIAPWEDNAARLAEVLHEM
jgi:hypothetical protein